MMRENLLERTRETWKPPRFVRLNSRTEKILAALRRFFDLQAGTIWRDVSAELKSVSGTLVDVGCGAQPYRSLVPPTVRYIGIDSAAALEKFGYQMPDTLYYPDNRWPVDNLSADVVLCTETLEHVREPDIFLSEALRCLRKGGKIILTVPFSARWHFIPYDYWRFTPSGLEQVLKRAGFSNIVVFGRGNAVSVACYKCMAVILQLLLPQSGNVVVKVLRGALGVLALPALGLMAVIAHSSFRFGAGDDCLGYSCTALRPKD